MEKQAIQSQLYALVDNLRGTIPPEGIIGALSLLGILVKFNPESFNRIYNSGGNHQVELLKSALSYLKEQHTEIPCEFGEYSYFPRNTWQALIFFIHDLSRQIGLLSPALRHLYSEISGKRGMSGFSDSAQELLIELIGDASKLSLYDGSAGLAGVPAAIKPETLFLEETYSEIWAISYRLLLMEGLQPTFENTNSLTNSQVNHKADLVVMQPPFGLRLSPQDLEKLANSKHVIVDPGSKLPSSASDALWIQQALSHANTIGRIFILLPQGWLFRGGYDAKVRDHLLDEDIIYAIIGLPPGMVNSTAIPTVLLVLDKQKRPGDPIHFVDAGNLGQKRRSSHILTSENIELIVKLAHGEQPDNSLYRAVHQPEIRKKGKNGIGGNSLSIKEYFDQIENLELPDVDEEINKLQARQMEFEKAQEALNLLLKGN